MGKVAAIQMISGEDIKDNLEQAARLLQQAVAQGAKLIVLPEDFAFMGNPAIKLKVKEKFGEGPIQAFLRQQAKLYQVWIVGGSIPLQAKQSDKLRAACLVFNDAGECVARYDKIHLFDVTISTGESYTESKFIEPGVKVCAVDTPFGKLGLSICYDLRFPEHYRKMLDLGAQIFTIPSAFTASTGQAHWEVLLRTRAIENSCYVIAANQGGFHASGRQTYGHSMIIGPWGDKLNQLQQGHGKIVTDLNLEQQADIRERFPSITHRVNL